MNRKAYTQERVFIGRLPQGSDLLASVTRIANEEGIKVGSVSIHGSVMRAVLTVFDQQEKFLKTIECEEGMEIATMSGTISQFKGRSMARLNGVLAAVDGTVIGGVLALGTIVYACEAVITEFSGGTLSRDFDMDTGLPLWKETSLLVEPSETDTGS
jgi:predicted DNA-binding protein with PD1-like motif